MLQTNARLRQISNMPKAEVLYVDRKQPAASHRPKAQVTGTESKNRRLATRMLRGGFSIPMSLDVLVFSIEWSVSLLLRSNHAVSCVPHLQATEQLMSLSRARHRRTARTAHILDCSCAGIISVHIGSLFQLVRHRFIRQLGFVTTRKLWHAEPLRFRVWNINRWHGVMGMCPS